MYDLCDHHSISFFVVGFDLQLERMTNERHKSCILQNRSREWWDFHRNMPTHSSISMAVNGIHNPDTDRAAIVTRYCSEIYYIYE